MNAKRQTAGETAKTKWYWGLIALVGLMLALTIEGSFITSGVGVAVFALGAWRGGYMEGGAA